MVRKHFAGRLVAVAGVALATACEHGDIVSAPRTGAPTIGTMAPSFDSAPAAGPGPMLSAIAANVCADVTSASHSPGTAIIAWACHGGSNQRFALEASGAITVYDGALCLDVSGGDAKDGDPVMTFPCHGGPNQKWTRTAAGELRTAVNGKCLDVSGAKPGAALIVWPCHGGPNQQWTVRDAAVAVAPAAPTPAAPAPVTPAAGAASAELPRDSVSTAMPAPTGRTISVAAGGDLQAALDAAQPGDVVVLAPGATFVGNFVLRTKANAAARWITVRTGGALPSEGTRVGPADAAQMPKLLTPNSQPALATAPGAQGWRLAGLEVGATTQAPLVYALVALGTAGAEQNTAAQVPSRIVLDRSYVHGSATLDLRRCVALNSASSAVVDSHLADCHSRHGDSQAILGWNGPGPYKIVNNYLEGGHEVVMFGGSDPTVAGVVPSDIEFRRNHVTRPTSWRGVWQVKNLFELKAGQRVLAEGNVFENNWASGQSGFAVVLMSLNQDGGCTWCVVQDVTFRHNRVVNTPQGFNLAALGSGSSGAVHAAVPTRRITISNNTVTGVDAGGGRMYQIVGTIADLSVRNNSGLAGGSDVYFTTPDAPLPTFVYRDNVGGSTYGVFADGGYMGNNALGKLGIPAGNVTGNVLYNGSGAFAVPANNTYVASAAALGLPGGDPALSLSSSFSSAGTGGSRPGADAAVIARMTQGVVR